MPKIVISLYLRLKTTKKMKWTLRFFALLDIICLCLLAEQAQAQFSSFTANETLTSLEFFSRTLFLISWLTLLVSAIFLAIPKKSGIIVYYFQLPLRFIFYMFSFGFISLVTYIINWPFLLNILTPVIIFGEFLRLYFTYRIHKQNF